MVGMARAGDPRCGGNPFCEEREEFLNSANSQFFIMFEPVPQLDGNYTIVGQVISGMEVVDAIKRGTGRGGAVIGQPDYITAVRVLD
jgi:peptidylprolyl isomerase